MDKYANELLDCASKLDAMVGECGQITSLTKAIVKEQDDRITFLLIKKIARIIEDKNISSTTRKMTVLLKDSLIRFYGHLKLVEICDDERMIEADSKSLKELLSEIDSMVGLKKVKEEVNDLIAYQKVQKIRQENNLHITKSTLHLAFLGNPGTGKTTVARIIGRIYKQIGLLSKGHFVEVSRTDLIAGYQGQTALKVKKVIEKSKGGVLFIDEAYSITENKNSDSYGRECLTELTKALEDYRDDLVVIVAGYTEPMKKFFESNPGLKSRFNTFIEFEDYSAIELEKILEQMCMKNDYILSENLKIKIKEYFSKIVQEKQENFANARLARNIYDDLVMNHAKRVVNLENYTKEDLSLIIDEDLKV